MKNIISETIEKETKSLVTKTEKLLTGFKVNSQPTLVKANDFLVEITQAEKRVIEREREILDPMNTAKKSIMAFFAPFKEKLANIKLQLKKEMGGYVSEMGKKELEKKAEIEKKVESGEMNIDKASVVLQKLEDKKDATTVRTHNVIEVIDESKIPDKYWVIDMVLLRKEALYFKERGIEIPGVKITEEKIIIGK